MVDLSFVSFLLLFLKGFLVFTVSKVRVSMFPFSFAG